MNDVVWTGTGGLSDIRTYRFIIVNAIFDRLSTSSLFSGFLCKRIHQALPIEAGIQIPFLGVWSNRMELGPDGDPNVGEFRFIHTCPIGIQILLKNNDPVKLRDKLDEAENFIMNQLFRDDTLTNLWKTDLPDSVKFESVTGQVEERWFIANASGTRSSAAETPLGEKQMQFDVVFRSMWYPTEFPALHRITVRTSFPEGSTPEEQLQVQQVTMVYQFDATTGDAVPYPLPADTDPPPNPFP